MSHKVNRLVFEVGGVQQNEAVELQNRISLFANNELIPEMGNIFDRIIPADRTITIDRLEINLKSITLDDSLEKQILDQLKVYFQDQNNFELNSQIPQVFDSFSSTKMYSIENEKLSSFKSSGSTQNDEYELLTGLTNADSFKSADAIERAYEIIKYFLLNGALPWNAAGLEKIELTKLFEICLENRQISRKIVLDILTVSPLFLIRFLSTLPKAKIEKAIQEMSLSVSLTQHIELENVIKALIESSHSKSGILPRNEIVFFIALNALKVLENENTSNVESIIRELKVISINSVESIEPQINEFTQAILTLIHDLQTGIKSDIKTVQKTEKYLEEKSTQNTESEWAGTLEDMIRKSQENSKTDSEGHPEKEDQLEESNFENFFANIKKSFAKTNSSGETESLNEFEVEIKSIEEKLKKFREKFDLENTSEIVLEESEPDEKIYYIQNAGLVILAPFFSHLFKELKLTEKNGFVSDEAQFKAVTLTSYIYSGFEEMNEQELTLNKILCGMPPKSVLPLDSVLTDEEKALADDLIQSAIGYWSALKNTGIDAFRSTFLKRNGIITSAAEGNWLLRIERAAFDVLLDTLPWPISVHRYSWMKKLLTVEW